MPASRVLASALAFLVTVPAAAQPPADRVPVRKPLWRFRTTTTPHAGLARFPNDKAAASTPAAEWLAKFYDQAIGNLVVHQDWLISQTLTELAVFPIKKRD